MYGRSVQSEDNIGAKSIDARKTEIVKKVSVARNQAFFYGSCQVGK